VIGRNSPGVRDSRLRRGYGKMLGTCCVISLRHRGGEGEDLTEDHGMSPGPEHLQSWAENAAGESSRDALAPS
jgi:hypothetical protein